MNYLTARALVRFVRRLIIVSLILLLPNWPSFFWEARLFLLFYYGPQLFMTLYLLGKDPALVKRRLKGGPAHEKRARQKAIMLLVIVFFVLMILASACDHRFNGSRFPVFLVLTADIIILLGFLIQFLVFKENTFASAVIEIAAEQKVISTGPYAIVRHPMYSGVFLVNIFTPIALGSWWGLPFALAIMGLIVLRILDEEKLLRQSLPNYETYCLNVTYRLIPHVW